MGLVNAPSFPSAGSQPEPKGKAKKSKKAEPIAEPIVVEECCALGCDDCFLMEEPIDE